ncbi:hypothetical protein ASPZODRAFT_129035 [Penicilliopsis zonata CBS 506.65]|uniref:Uncharacterized protein n=1 Tax=Penicilliopsis zonata CBS 506.65 TaxID=1073090 RepID=A0A1L9ST78_9EURO|nr:hypothetical protein ASPZODRAFT_129035 [Penicilliopsis zonata CBS 506.65]OJJ50410.1 hypothetical protein ASPZODRAFT_129035 [Penicilliopsis zonata CBS 506.65]
MALTTRNPTRDPIQKDYTSSAVAFVSSDGPDIHLGLGGASKYNFKHDQFVVANFHRSLEGLLRDYLPMNLGLEFPENAKQLEQLSAKLAGAEEGYKDRGRGFWHSIWYKIGEADDVVDTWVSLIPNEYGLAVVKTGLAVVFKLAERSAERRRSIMNTFVAIRDALARANPENRSFRTHKDVSACADRLTQTIIQSIEDMIKLTSSKQKSLRRLRIPKLGQHKTTTPAPDPVPDQEAILKKINQATKEFEDAINLARDNMIEATGFTTQGIALQLPEIRADLRTAGNQLRVMDRKRDRRDEDQQKSLQKLNTMMQQVLASTEKIAKREQDFQMDQVVARSEVVHFLREHLKKEDEIIRLCRQQQRYAVNLGVIVREDQLLEILTLAAGESELARLLRQPNDDLQLALKYKGKLSQASQRQVQAAVVTDDRVLQWLHGPDPDLIMIDAANVSLHAGMSKISVITVFSAAFITSLINARPDDVVVAHYFCGQHVRAKDPWHGPNGVVRFLTMQLLMSLMNIKRPNLSFIKTWDHFRKLEDHHLGATCHLLHSIVAQFPPHMTVSLVIDSISRADTFGNSNDLEVVMERFHRLVTDVSLRPTVKVFLTNTMQCTPNMLQSDVFQDDPTRLVSLYPNKKSVSQPALSEQVMGNTLFG